MQSTRRTRRLVTVATVACTAAALAACSDPAAEGGDVSEDDPVAVTLITKDSVNPFFLAMQEGAEAAAEEFNVDIEIASGKTDGDEQGQIQAIEAAISRGDQGILITPNGPGVNPAIEDARDAGLYVIALDTPPDPPDTVDVTFATDNFEAGELIGTWAAETLQGEDATIALLDLFTDQVVSVDYNRDQGFLTGMGIDTADPETNGDEEPTGEYTGGQGGSYEIVCNEETNGNPTDGRTAMETCLQQNEDINVVYTINEPSAQGAYEAIQQAGIPDPIIVSVDGGCEGVRLVQDEVIDATSQQYPLEMARLGVEEIANIARGGEPQEPTEGLDFVNTGVNLVTDNPVDGVESIDTAEGLDLCWGE